MWWELWLRFFRAESRQSYRALNSQIPNAIDGRCNLWNVEAALIAKAASTYRLRRSLDHSISLRVR